MDKIMLTIPEAAELLGIKKSKAYELVAAGVIPSKRLGGRCTRISRAALEEWAKSNENHQSNSNRAG